MSKVLDEEDAQDTDYDTDDLSNLHTDSESDTTLDDTVGMDPDSEGDPQ